MVMTIFYIAIPLLDIFAPPSDASETFASLDRTFKTVLEKCDALFPLPKGFPLPREYKTFSHSHSLRDITSILSEKEAVSIHFMDFYILKLYIFSLDFLLLEISLKKSESL